MRFPELRSSPPRKVISEGVAMSAAFDFLNISEKKFPFFEEGRGKKGRGGGAVSVLLIYFSYLTFLTSSMGVGGGGGLVAIKWSGPRTLQGGNRVSFWTESL